MCSTFRNFAETIIDNDNDKKMKLRFSIHYNTAWGESLHVVLAFHRQDGTVRRQNLLMLTDDGELWTLETSALIGRQHALSHIVYAYQVENGEGQVLRREWDVIPRIYYFDTTKDYVFPDEWRDRPLPMHLYSAAYQTTTGLSLTSDLSPLTSKIQPLRLPLFRRTVLFRVSAPQLKAGQAVAVGVRLDDGDHRRAAEAALDRFHVAAQAPEVHFHP